MNTDKVKRKWQVTRVIYVIVEADTERDALDKAWDVPDDKWRIADWIDGDIDELGGSRMEEEAF